MYGFINFDNMCRKLNVMQLLIYCQFCDRSNLKTSKVQISVFRFKKNLENLTVIITQLWPFSLINCVLILQYDIARTWL